MKTDIETVCNDVSAVKLPDVNELSAILYDMNNKATSTQATRMASLMLAGPSFFILCRRLMSANVANKEANCVYNDILEFITKTENTIGKL